jgi:hypothetical protein
MYIVFYNKKGDFKEELNIPDGASISIDFTKKMSLFIICAEPFFEINYPLNEVGAINFLHYSTNYHGDIKFNMKE